jgi:hypothetical protein
MLVGLAILLGLPHFSMNMTDTADTTRPRLHIVTLPVQNDDQERSFRDTWYLDDEKGRATPIVPAEDSSDTSSSWKGLNTNDLLYFPGELSGAGEFEGCRLVGEETSEGYRLLSAGIESPVFAAQIVASIEPVTKLRVFYEELFEVVLQKQGLSLADLFGGQDGVEEFWSKPDTAKDRSSVVSEDGNTWRIAVSECTWLATMEASQAKLS